MNFADRNGGAPAWSVLELMRLMDRLHATQPDTCCKIAQIVEAPER